MKHEKEWYTCDRCGEEIEENIYDWKMFHSHITRPADIINIISNEPYGILRGYHKKEKLIHLCGKCRKDFEKFMNNKI